ncbi:MAG: ISKra4 family transposase ISSysp7 [Chroococcidiopsis cubana SAG 39.79]|uniref:ISKra4 family transposase n=1 Tax=Chroococcidiopsis cubana SAG 39.79 TaxID=388085 RepID=A0AB37UDA8_9CYAN|nr:ISKra4 family transposase [Chroococcidiopsis cubana]MDZ4877319.1 ISKra4 family transposase ISSysp7 [Chroococcidiopsis cubana SAG 39.79]PSB62436.1 ISKra4 family transposase [Chroococcidiopsis cubana CCALA 043]RUT05869.1 hypothetical protein DSM107010_53990 [Chroococcidiopsis cubana SAG 39.79]
MKIKIQVVIESDCGAPQITQEVAQIERGSLQPENLGLSLTEAKTLLQNTQRTLVEQQVAEYEKQHLSCLHCEKKLLHKDKRTSVYRTLFGKLHLRSNKLFHCTCIEQQSRSFNPLANLLTERTSPELLYLESKFASLMSYGLSVKLLQELLPLEGQINATTVRNHLHAVATRLESELGEEKGAYIEGCPRDWEELPRPDLPIVVGMDGGYVRSYDKQSKSKSNFEVMVGKCIKADGTSKRFSFAYCYDTKPQRRIFEVLKSLGMQMNQQVTFLSDGDEKIRDLLSCLNPNAEYLLDWFHITMRITVMNQVAKGLTKRDPETSKYILKDLTSVKWYLWHGNVFKALELIEELLDNTFTLADHEKKPCLEAKKLYNMMEEFHTYISNNGAYIPNYGERWRCGEVISTGFTESAVNQVISKRFVKKQQMRWTPKGAHLLLQVRTLVLNEELRSKFQQWYSGLTLDSKQNQQMPHAT